MSAGAHKQEDRLNNVTIIVVGICGAVLVYVSIVALQAYYAYDTAATDAQATYGGQRAFYETVRASEELAISGTGDPGTFKMPIGQAMKLVAVEAKGDAANLVPTIGRSDVPTSLPVFGRPQDIPPPAAPAAVVAPPAAASPGPSPGPGMIPAKPIGKLPPKAPPAKTVPTAPAAGGNAPIR